VGVSVNQLWKEPPLARLEQVAARLACDYRRVLFLDESASVRSHWRVIISRLWYNYIPAFSAHLLPIAALQLLPHAEAL
jgi:hypothetical protein